MQNITFLIIISVNVDSCPQSSGIIWTELGDNCFHVSKESLSWDESKRYCTEKGGFLAEILSQNEENLLDTFLVGGISYWLGLTDSVNEGK